jgi:DNA sulfur modification protein DndD
MKIKSITLENFGPYYGIQHIDLATDSVAPIVLVYGENMRGKTSLLRAIRWALYGKVLSHEGEELDSTGFANYDARDESSSVTVSVEIVFDEESNDVTLKRSFVLTSNDESGLKVTQEQIFLKPANGPAMPTKDIPEAVAKILHSEVSDFFLFDGETLSDFETKLRSKESKSILVRSSIERILGFQSLQLLKKDLGYFQSIVAADLRRLAKQGQKNKEVLDKLNQLDESLKAKEVDKVNLSEILVAVKVAITESEKKLAAVEEIRDSLIARNMHEDQLRASKDKLKFIKEQISDLLSVYWWVPLSPWIESKISLLEEKLDLVNSKNRKRIEIELVISQLETQVNVDRCERCSQEISQVRRDEIAVELKNLKQKLSDLALEETDLYEIQQDRKSLKNLSSAVNARLRLADLDKDFGAESLSADQIQLKINTLSEVIQGNPISITAEDKTLQENRLNAVQIERTIEEYERQIDLWKNEQRNLLRGLQGASESNDPLRTHGRVLDYFDDLLDGSLDQFRELMRQSVESEATDIFRQLSTEPEYDGIKITSKFLIELVDQQGRIMERPSAGAQQILAMSFIGALVRCAVRRGPVIMDTPFGRLDLGHRKSILGWVPTLGTQVILLVQSGEFDRDRDLGYLNNQVASEFVLERVSATRTSIVKRKVV